MQRTLNKSDSRLILALACTGSLVLSINASLAQNAANKPKTQKWTAEQIKAMVKTPLQIEGMRMTKVLPSNFPVAQYPSNVLRTDFSNSTKGSPTAAATIVTKDPPEKVFNWYQDFFRRDRWKSKTPTAQAMQKIGKAGELFLISAQKERNDVNLFLVKNPNEPGTLINVSWALKAVETK